MYWEIPYPAGIKDIQIKWMNRYDFDYQGTSWDTITELNTTNSGWDAENTDKKEII